MTMKSQQQGLDKGRMDIQMKVYIVENHQILINYLLK